LYLPHLRNAVFSHLIAADTAAEEASGRTAPWIEAQAADFNLDARQEIRLANDKLVAYLAPAQGGQLYELDIRAVPLNLVATLTRRPEPYHARIAQAARQPSTNDAGPTHELRVKQADLDQRLVYDPYRRRSLIDHFVSPDVTLDDLTACRAVEQGDFLAAVYERPRIRRNPDRIQIGMSRTGQVGGHAIRMSKSVTLSQESAALEVRYTLEDLPREFPFHFAVELAFAGLAAGAPDRYFYSAAEPNLGQLESQLDLQDIDLIGLVDGWLGLDVAMNFSRPAGVWAFPIETVSQSEGGFELVHQSTTILPRWPVRPDARGRWTVELTLALDTSAAEAKRHADALA
jgi:alpha-amylase